MTQPPSFLRVRCIQARAPKSRLCPGFTCFELRGAQTSVLIPVIAELPLFLALPPSRGLPKCPASSKYLG